MVGFEKRTERTAELTLGAFSCPGCRNSCRRWAAIEDQSAQNWTAHVLADAKNGRRPASDSGISDNTRIPAQKLESTTSDAGRMRRPPKSKALSCFFFPNQVRHDGRGHPGPQQTNHFSMLCRTKSEPTQNSKSKCTSPYASNIPSGSSQTATALPAIATRGDSPNCLPLFTKRAAGNGESNERDRQKATKLGFNRMILSASYFRQQRFQS